MNINKSATKQPRTTDFYELFSKIKVGDYDLDMGISWKAQNGGLAGRDYSKFSAVLQINPGADAPFAELFAATQKNRAAKTPGVITTSTGTLVTNFTWDESKSVFANMELIRKALVALDAQKSVAVDFSCLGEKIFTPEQSAIIVRTVLIACAKLPGDKRNLLKILFAGVPEKDVSEAAIFAEANTLARGLCRLPPNYLVPPVFAKVVQKLASAHANLNVSIINEAQLKKIGAGAILAVAAASRDKPQIIVLKYRGKNVPKHNSAPLAVIGKGVCYDTGGINVKPAASMLGMKVDMGGAATALAGVFAAARLNLPINIDCYLPVVDNSISPDAYRPDDVVTALNGKTIEIINSDAEGRMILADTITLATRGKEKPSGVITMATLTGVMHMALGDHISGFLSNDKTYEHSALHAGEATGDRLCYFPFIDEYRERLDSKVADLKQCSTIRPADSIVAAIFLREFFAAAVPWVHMDLSAICCDEGLGGAPGPETGFGAMWLLEFIKQRLG